MSNTQLRNGLKKSGKYPAQIYAVPMNSEKPLVWDIGSLELPIPHPEASEFDPLPEIFHQFKEERRADNIKIAYAFVILSLSPWLLLLSGVCTSYVVDIP